MKHDNSHIELRNSSSYVPATTPSDCLRCNECGCAYPGFRTLSQDRRAALSLRLAGTGKNITRGYDEQGLARKLCHRPFGIGTVADCERQHGRVCAQVCYG